MGLDQFPGCGLNATNPREEPWTAEPSSLSAPTPPCPCFRHCPGQITGCRPDQHPQRPCRPPGRQAARPPAGSTATARPLCARRRHRRPCTVYGWLKDGQLTGLTVTGPSTALRDWAPEHRRRMVGVQLRQQPATALSLHGEALAPHVSPTTAPWQGTRSAAPLWLRSPAAPARQSSQPGEHKAPCAPTAHPGGCPSWPCAKPADGPCRGPRSVQMTRDSYPNTANSVAHPYT